MKRRPDDARRLWPYWVVVAVLIVGLGVTGGLFAASRANYSANERRLLNLRVKELGSVLTEALPTIQTPLASAAALADATNGNVAKFRAFMTPYASARGGREFNSVSLWRLAAPSRGPLAVVGGPPALASAPALAQAFLSHAAVTPALSVTGLAAPLVGRLGYAYTTPGPGARFIAYGESALSPSRRSQPTRGGAFSDLDFAFYLGPRQRAADLLLSDLATLPISGQHATLRVPFGDTDVTVVVAARQPLGGTLPQRLPWIIAIAGLVLSLGAAALTLRLLQRRTAAENLAGRLEEAVEENRRLYAEQRTIARTLQHALLPEALPSLPGAEASARYEPGERGVEVGGDWYDLIALDDDQLLVVVGDVSGRGLAAARTMASLRFAIHAYAAERDSPSTILDKLSTLLDVGTSGRLATVLCALVDVPGRCLTLASAGHLPPLLVGGDGARYLEPQVGPPIGVPDGAPYGSSTVAAPPSATLLAFTDGLVERRGESIDVGLERLRVAASSPNGALPELLGRIVAELRPGPAEDDTAIVGFRWTE